MARCFDVEITVGSHEGPYTIYYVDGTGEHIAEIDPSGEQAIHVTYEELIKPDGVKVCVPDDVITLKICNEVCNNCTTFTPTVIVTPTPPVTYDCNRVTVTFEETCDEAPRTEIINIYRQDTHNLFGTDVNINIHDTQLYELQDDIDWFCDNRKTFWYKTYGDIIFRDTDSFFNIGDKVYANETGCDLYSINQPITTLVFPNATNMPGDLCGNGQAIGIRIVNGYIVDKIYINT